MEKIGDFIDFQTSGASKAHLVLTAERDVFDFAKNGPVIQNIIRNVALEKNVNIISGKLTNKYLYLFVSYPDSFSLDAMAKYIKEKTSEIICNLDNFSDCGDNGFWKKNYFAMTSGTEFSERFIKKTLDHYLDEVLGHKIINNTQSSRKGKVLVTGGTGYIGSHTAVELLNEGYEVYIIDNLSNSRLDVLDGIEKITGKRPYFEKMDLCDEKKVDDFFWKNHGIDTVIHFAAFKAVGESVEQPTKYYKNNILPLLNLKNAMENYGVKNFVYSSSASVYGEPEKLPITEDSPIQKPNSPYGYTKQIAEQIIQDMTDASDAIHAIALRYFNPIGAHESGLIGELPLGKPNNLVPIITQTAAGVIDELKVFGNDYNTPDGSAVRDYIHIVDLGRAHLAAMDRLTSGKNKSKFEIYNIGTGKGVSVLEAINAFEDATGEKVNYKIVERRPGDVAQIYADTSLAKRELNWEVTKTLKEAMLSAWKWEKNYRSKSK